MNQQNAESKLGPLLRTSRDLKGMTLRQVEEAVGISNAYLSMLESGKIKKPSANVLYKLSSLYCISLDSLLIACGIINKNEGLNPCDPNSVFGKIPLTPDEEKQLLKYLNFLRYGTK